MADFLRNSNKGRLLQDSVGFADPSLTKVTWLMQRELPAQFACCARPSWTGRLPKTRKLARFLNII